MRPDLDRRYLVFAPAAVALTGATLSGCVSLVVPRSIEVSKERLQEAIARRFPVSRRVAESIDLTIAVPRLTMLAESNRVAIECEVTGGERSLRRPLVGTLAVSNGLAFDATDGSVRMIDVRVEQFHVEGLDAGLDRTIERFARPLLQGLLQRQAIYTLRPRDVDRLREAGVVPGEYPMAGHRVVVPGVRADPA